LDYWLDFLFNFWLRLCFCLLLHLGFFDLLWLFLLLFFARRFYLLRCFLLLFLGCGAFGLLVYLGFRDGYLFLGFAGGGGGWFLELFQVGRPRISSAMVDTTQVRDL